MKAVILSLILVLLITPGLAQTMEAVVPSNGLAKSLQETDITFWQTFPYATIWGYFIDAGTSNIFSLAGAPHWGPILGFSVGVAAVNAVLHTQKVMKHEGTGDNH
jgi:hypothetical protein